MLTRRNLFGFSLAVIGMALLAGNANPAIAQNGGGRNSSRLVATMFAGVTKGVAKYEQRTDRRKFTFELEKGTPGTIITVRHNGTILATRQISALGTAKVDFDTTNGHAVPVMTSGQVISVWVGNTMVMGGALR